MMDLFHDVTETAEQQLAPGAVLLRGFALPGETELLAGLEGVIARAPFRHMVTPGGYRMSVGMTNCGSLGWVTDRAGYRYDAVDPESGKEWPPMPGSFLRLAQDAAASAGFGGFLPDGCLINRYEPGAKLVSVSLGIPAVFLFGGLKRADKPSRVDLRHGDVVVWGGPARLRYHGVMPLKDGHHPLLEPHRINLPFRKAG